MFDSSKYTSTFTFTITFTNSKFELPKTTAIDINKIIISLDTSKATGLLKWGPMLLTGIYPISLPVAYQKINILSMLKQLQ